MSAKNGTTTYDASWNHSLQNTGFKNPRELEISIGITQAERVN